MHHVCYAEDHENFNIKKYFSETYEFLEKALRVTNVLVHCMAGISRSAAVVIAYLVRKKQIGVLEAMELVRSCRWQIYPNNGKAVG